MAGLLICTTPLHFMLFYTINGQRVPYLFWETLHEEIIYRNAPIYSSNEAAILNEIHSFSLVEKDKHQIHKPEQTFTFLMNLERKFYAPELFKSVTRPFKVGGRNGIFAQNSFQG